MSYSNVVLTKGRLGVEPKTLISSVLQARRWFLATFLVVFASIFAAQSAIAQEAATSAVVKVGINSASADILAARLKGVGQSRAEEIVRYREAYGRFDSVDELTEVKGIGPSTLEMNRQLITLE